MHFFCSCLSPVIVHLCNLFLLSAPVARMLLTPTWVSRQKHVKYLSTNISKLKVETCEALRYCEALRSIEVLRSGVVSQYILRSGSGGTHEAVACLRITNFFISSFKTNVCFLSMTVQLGVVNNHIN